MNASKFRSLFPKFPLNTTQYDYITYANTTYRGFGTERFVFQITGKILTNTEIMENQSANANSITTNSINLTDVFSCYAPVYDLIKIRAIDP